MTSTALVARIRRRLARALDPHAKLEPPPIRPPRATVLFDAGENSKACEVALQNGGHLYHSFDFTNGFHAAGDWDVAADVAAYRLPDVRGKRVLEIGPASGWFSFYLETLGADVTVVETRGYGDFDQYGVDAYTGAGSQPANRVIDGRPVWYGPVSASFWTMHDLLKSKVAYVNGRAYEVGPDMFPEPFDLVLICAVLPHLRDPVGALRAAHSVCKPDGLCIATSPTWAQKDGDPAPMQALPNTAVDTISWWAPNKAAFRHWFMAAGFKSVDVEETLHYTPDRELFSETGMMLNAPQILRLAHARP